MNPTCLGLAVMLIGAAVVGACVVEAAGPTTGPSTTTSPAGTQPVVRLWDGDAPGAKGNAEADIPTLTVFRAPEETATGAAVVVCPGGGYGHLAVEKEGLPAVRWLNSLGVHAFILKYRLGPT